MLLLKNCSWIVTQNAKHEILRNKDVLIEDDRIAELGSNLTTKDYVINCENKILLPGLINSHTHLPMTLFRGYADDLPLQDWLETKIWPLEANLTEEHVYYGALLGILELIRNGITTFNDMYFFGNAVKRAVEKSGIRALFGQAVVDFPTAEFKNSSEAFKLFESLAKSSSELFMPTVGVHSLYTCSKETLLKAKELSKKYETLLHIHAAETRKEVYDSLKEHGKRPVEYLSEIGFLGGNVVAVHLGWITKGEVSILGKTGAKAVHCPISNMKLAVGSVPPLAELFNENVVVALGTDSAVSNNSLDLFEEMKVATLLQKMHRWDARVMPAQVTLDLATINGAKALAMEHLLGSVEVGKKADLVLVDLKKPHLTPCHNIISNLVYSTKGSDVTTTIVDGKILMENYEFKTLNEEEILAKASSCAFDLANKLEK
ncbi:MAG: amidohydrolase [Candidatus Thermoplasmatota archaeon]